MEWEEEEAEERVAEEDWVAAKGRGRGKAKDKAKARVAAKAKDRGKARVEARARGRGVAARGADAWAAPRRGAAAGSACVPTADTPNRINAAYPVCRNNVPNAERP